MTLTTNTRFPFIFLLRGPEDGQGSGQQPAQPAQPQTVRVEEEPFDDPFLRGYKDPSYVDEDDDDYDGDDDSGDDDETIDDLLKMYQPKDDADTPKSSIDPQANQRAAQDMGNQLKDAVDNMKFPDDMFDEGFNNGDPQAVRRSMEKMTRFAVQQAIGLAMKPTTMALRQMHEHISENMATQIKNAQGQTSQRAKLEAAVPALADPASAELLKPMLEHLKAQGATHQDQVKALNAIAHRLNLNKKAKAAQGNTNQRRKDGRAITGTSALDSLFGS